MTSEFAPEKRRNYTRNFADHDGADNFQGDSSRFAIPDFCKIGRFRLPQNSISSILWPALVPLTRPWKDPDA